MQKPLISGDGTAAQPHTRGDACREGSPQVRIITSALLLSPKNPCRSWLEGLSCALLHVCPSDQIDLPTENVLSALTAKQ